MALRTTPRCRVVLGLVAATLALAACGIPMDDGPRDMSSGDDLRSPGVGTPPDGSASTDSPVVFLVDQVENRYVAVRRNVRRTPREVIESLLAGPTDEDRAANRTSEIPVGLSLLGAGFTSSTVITIDLRIEPSSPGLTAQAIDAIGQMVFTATSLPCARGVLFTLNGRATDLQDQFGRLQQRPLTRDDFDSSRPPFSANDARRNDTECST